MLGISISGRVTAAWCRCSCSKLDPVLLLLLLLLLSLSSPMLLLPALLLLLSRPLLLLLLLFSALELSCSYISMAAGEQQAGETCET
jgi:hypothetical protein